MSQPCTYCCKTTVQGKENRKQYYCSKVYSYSDYYGMLFTNSDAQGDVWKHPPLNSTQKQKQQEMIGEP